MLARLANLSKFSTPAMLPPAVNHQDLIIIRHAQSNFNKGFLDYRRLHNLDLEWDECIKDQQFNQSVSYARDYIDCSITEAGRLQCSKARQALMQEDIGIVLVSPYQRALETCSEIFAGREIRVEVHPILAEVFRYSCDISHHMEEKTKQFPSFDFSFMKDHSELWFLEALSEHIKNTCSHHFQTQGVTSYAEKQEKLLELLQSKVIYESPQELRMRIWRIKELLGEYRKKYKKIAIVSHFYTIATLTATKFNEIGEIIDFQEVFNATPVRASIDQLLAVK